MKHHTFHYHTPCRSHDSSALPVVRKVVKSAAWGAEGEGLSAAIAGIATDDDDDAAAEDESLEAEDEPDYDDDATQLGEGEVEAPALANDKAAVDVPPPKPRAKPAQAPAVRTRATRRPCGRTVPPPPPRPDPVYPLVHSQVPKGQAGFDTWVDPKSDKRQCTADRPVQKITYIKVRRASSARRRSLVPLAPPLTDTLAFYPAHV